MSMSAIGYNRLKLKTTIPTNFGQTHSSFDSPVQVWNWDQRSVPNMGTDGLIGHFGGLGHI